MIPIQCACGKSLKLKDEMAGRRVRCPACSEIVQVPKADADDDFLDDLEDDESDELPEPKSSSKNSKKSSKKPAKKPLKKKSSSQSGSGSTSKKIFGFLSLGVGVLILVAFVAVLFSGEFQPKRLGGLVVPFAMIGMGWAWIKGETYGG